MLKYIIDVDGTVCSITNGEYHEAKPYPERIKKINDLYSSGHYICYWTARGGRTGENWYDLTKKQLDDWGCLYHEVNVGKPSYDYWIDDKAINSGVYFK